MSSIGTWAFSDEPLIHGDRVPSLQPDFAGPMDDLLQDIGRWPETVDAFAEAWDDLKGKHDPAADLVGTAAAYQIEGDRVHFFANYDQWDGGDEVWIPLALVEEMIDQYLGWVRARH
ncbi:MAG: hypothetical protein WAM30_13625 [Candidatus Dormiibacterota bacterium]